MQADRYVGVLKGSPQKDHLGGPAPVLDRHPFQHQFLAIWAILAVFPLDGHGDQHVTCS